MASSSGSKIVNVPLSRVVLVSLTAALGGFLFGFDTSVINGAVDAISKQFNIGGFLLGFTVSSALVGGAVGAWYAGPISDRIGRVRTMQIAAILFLVSSIGSGLAFGPWDLMLWRIIGGLGVGAASIVTPAYIAEIAPPAYRGRLGTLQQLAIVTGIFVALLSDAGFVAAAGTATADIWGLPAWRWMFIAEAVPALIYYVLTYTLPESPRYLIGQGKKKEAVKVLTRYVGGDVDETTKEIEDSFAGDTRRPRLSILRGKDGKVYPVVWVGLALAVFQQFTGINVIFYYSSTLWQSVGFGEQDSLTITVITSVTNIVTTIVAIFLIDKVGRKPLLLVGSIGQFVSLSTLAIIFGTAPVVNGNPELPGATGVIALIAANVFVIFFGSTWGPVMWVMLGEMFPNKIRVMALAVAGAAQWGANFLVSTTFPPMAELSLGLAYGTYALFAFLSIFFVSTQVRETKGKTLEQMSTASKKDASAQKS